MPNVNFYLDNKKDYDLQFIYLYCRYNRNTFKYNTGEKVKQLHWNKEKQRVKAQCSGAAEINELLDFLSKKVLSVFREFKLKDQIPSSVDLKKSLIIVPSENNKSTNLFSLFEEFIETNKSTKSKNTIKNYQGVLNHLKQFNVERNYKLDFSKVDQIFYQELVNYCIENDLSDNSTFSIIKNLKVFLKFAEDRGAKINFDFRKFKATYRNPDRIFLTWDEVNAIRKLKLSKRKSLDDVRDVYLFACFTGLRYSDIEKLKPEHIQEFKDKKGKKISIIKLNQQKTKEYLEIALNEYALEIIKKHEGKYLNCLPVISNQKTNDHLKEIGELAKLTNQVSKVSFVGSKKVEELVPKHEMLTMHTARHTFATLSLQKGMSIEVLQKLLGHNKISNTQIYAKIVDEHKHAAMIDVWKKKR